MGRPSGVAESFEALAARKPAAPEEITAFSINFRLDIGVIFPRAYNGGAERQRLVFVPKTGCHGLNRRDANKPQRKTTVRDLRCAESKQDALLSPALSSALREDRESAP